MATSYLLIISFGYFIVSDCLFVKYKIKFFSNFYAKCAIKKILLVLKKKISLNKKKLRQKRKRKSKKLFAEKIMLVKTLL